MLQPRQLDFCLLIPCYNNYRGLIESIRSVNYPMERYLVLVIDDGSKDPVDQQKLNGDLMQEHPFVLLRNEKNLGITKTLNKGLAWCRGNIAPLYIARLDCGDVCDGTRFYEQVRAMERDPALVLLGSWCLFIDRRTGSGYKYTTPLDHEDIREEMYVRNVFIHPTIMIRSSALGGVGDYPEDHVLAEDYALCWKLMNAGRVAILDQFLVNCEINRRGLSFENKSKQLKARWKVVRTLGNRRDLQWMGFIRLLGLFVTPKRLILWIKQRKRR